MMLQNRNNLTISQSLTPTYRPTLFSTYLMHYAVMIVNIVNVVYVGQLNGNEANEVRFREIP